FLAPAGESGPASDATRPLPNREALIVLPEADCLPLIPVPTATGLRMVPWSAAACEALGAEILILRGDRILDTLDRALRLADLPLPDVPADALRLVLTSGQLAAVPLPAVPDGSGEGLEMTTDVLAAFCAALVPDDPADGAGWAALGALLYHPRGPHPWLRAYRHRQGTGTPPAYHFAAFAPVLDLTWGLPLYCEQVTLLNLLLRQDDAVPAGGRLQVEEWIGQAERWATPYALALAAGERLHLALRLKVAHPATFLAGALETVVLAGDTAAVSTLVLEARRRAVELRPPDVQISQAGFTLEAPLPTSDEAGPRPPGDGPPAAIRWGLAWSQADRAAATALVTARGKQPGGRFVDLAALCAAAVEAHLTPGYVANLIRAGACDTWGPRDDLLAALPPALAAAGEAHAAAQRAAGAGQMGLFDAPAGAAGAQPGSSAALGGTEHVGMEGASENGASAVHSAGGADAPLARWRAWESSLLGWAFTPPAGAGAILGRGAQRTATGVARTTLGAVGPAHVGQTVSVAVVLDQVRVVPAGPGAAAAESLAVALAQDATGALPVVIFPPVYLRFQAQAVAGTPVILVARVQLAEAAEGQGAGMVLLAEQLLHYQVQRETQELDVTPRKRPAPRAAAPAKAPADPLQYSVSGQRYLQAARPAAVAGADPGPESAPPEAPAEAPAEVLITLHPLADEQADEERMRRLKEILVHHPGSTRVRLYFPDDPLVGGPTYMPLK
ncbi:MAG TPA: hypothetical protein VM536_03660, partial [Chloroflexia bacterium]|nr:hypothetical protein [Chloroflexia bacterium]